MKITFKKCSKKEWKEKPSYTVYIDGIKRCTMYYFEGEEKPVLELSSRTYGGVEVIWDYDEVLLFPAIHDKMVEFHQEVMKEVK